MPRSRAWQKRCADAGQGAGGVTASSSALIADAVHSLSDIVADLVALATLVFGCPNRRHP